MDRRTFAKTALPAAAALCALKTSAQTEGKSGLPLRISLNCGTLRHYNLPVERQIELVAAAGFEGIELWVPHIEESIKNGATTASIKKKLADCSLKLENVLGFAKWFDDDPQTASAAFAQLKNEIALTAEIGCTYIAATGYGMSKLDPLKFGEYAARYRELLDYAEKFGVSPLLELWGHRAWSKLADIAHIAISSGHKNANLLLDFYHIYRGGNSFESLEMLNCARLPVFHINDYPATPPADKLADADRVLPSDGVCDFKRWLPMLYKNGFRGALSLEIFNPVLWQKYDAAELLKIGYKKTAECVKKSFA